ncbi:hypothetical protein ACA910_013890 [Epithemia clementina (nom. ined.)]
MDDDDQRSHISLESSVLGSIRRTEQQIDRQIHSLYDGNDQDDEETNSVNFNGVLLEADAASQASYYTNDTAVFSADVADLQRELAQATRDFEQDGNEDLLLAQLEDHSFYPGSTRSTTSDERSKSMTTSHEGAEQEEPQQAMDSPCPRRSSLSLMLGLTTYNQDSNVSLRRRPSLPSYYELVRQPPQGTKSLKSVEDRSCEVVSISSADSSLLTPESTSFLSSQRENQTTLERKKAECSVTKMMPTQVVMEVPSSISYCKNKPLLVSAAAQLDDDLVSTTSLLDDESSITTSDWENFGRRTRAPAVKKISQLYSGDMLQDWDLSSTSLTKQPAMKVPPRVFKLSLFSILISLAMVLSVGVISSSSSSYNDFGAALSPLAFLWGSRTFTGARKRFRRNSRMLVVDRRAVKSKTNVRRVVIEAASPPKPSPSTKPFVMRADSPASTTASTAINTSEEESVPKKVVRRWSCKVLGRHRCPSLRG